MQEGTIEIKSAEYIEKVRNYAVNCHANTNHLYDKHPYEFHLKHVVMYCNTFDYLIESTIDSFYVTAACWCHDLIEDARETYGDVKKIIGQKAADMVYAVTNEKGKTRKERANAKYYRGIRKTPYAVFVKLCDRLANAQYSLEKHEKNPLTANGMYDKYCAENNDFIWSLIKPEWYQLNQWLTRLIAGKNAYFRIRIYEHKYRDMIWALQKILSK